MFATERQQQILELLRKENSATVNTLSRNLYVSAATIRRDLTELAHAGLINRSHGGAILIEGGAAESPISVRELQQTKEKRVIAELVLPLIRPNSVLFMDSSSTVGMVIPLLSQHRGLTVITNGLGNALLLSHHTDAKIYMPEGMVNSRSTSVVGGGTLCFLERFRAELALISCSGLALSEEVTDASPEQSDVKRMMLQNARAGVCLCDTSKLGEVFMCRTCGFEDLHTLVMDKAPDSPYRIRIQKAGCRMLFPQSRNGSGFL
ncbi:MAG: DeoR/GlpR family DNA-binding transcription regulator [Acetanaerobacterium sp.]